MAKWDEPQGPDYARDEPEFMAEHGRALAAWGGIEHALARIYVKLLAPKDAGHATQAFFAVQNFRDRTNMVASLVRSHFEDSNHHHAVEWGRIQKAIAGAAQNRNSLAHLHVWHGPDTGTFGHSHIFEVARLPLDPKERAKEVVTVKRIKDYRAGFRSLWQRLDRFLEAI